MILKQGSKIKFDHDFQEVVLSFQTPETNNKGDVRAFSYAPPPFDIKDVIWQPFCFKKQGQNYSRASFPRHLHFVQI